MSNWNVNFKSIEAHAPHVETVSNTLEYGLTSLAFLISFSLFVAAGHFSKEGNAISSISCGVGAVVVALGPYVAKNFV